MARFYTQRARPIASIAWLVACSSCAQVLGIPSDLELTDPPPSREAMAPSFEGSDGPLPAPLLGATSGGPMSEAVDERGARSDGVWPPGDVVGIDQTVEPPIRPSGGGPAVPKASPSVPSDAGAADGGGAPRARECDGRFERVAVDVVFIVDNSGSMPEEAQAFEQALPTFVADLDEDGVDHRIILLSRHRRDERTASAEASTSVCISAPLSGAAACPSARPALGPRFFPYSIKIDDGDSLSQVVEAFAAPDDFDLTAVGWSEWLRSGARTIFIEITDSDSALGSNEFVTALQTASPHVFGSDPAQPGFVFHAVTGLDQKSFAPDIYFAAEPIESSVCQGAGSDADNPGVVYQELSRSTGGLRLPVCPPAALGLRLAALASDVALRSFRECPVSG